MAYIGCFLFGLIFLVMYTQSTGSLQARVAQTFDWIHDWAPFSYIIILAVLASPFIVMTIMNSWPKLKEPEDPMAKYRKQAAQGLIEEPDDVPPMAPEVTSSGTDL